MTTLISIQQESGSELSGLLTTLKDVISSESKSSYEIKGNDL